MLLYKYINTKHLVVNNTHENLYIMFHFILVAYHLENYRLDLYKYNGSAKSIRKRYVSFKVNCFDRYLTS